eukprot:gene14097-19024_t
MTDPLHKSGPQPGFIVVLEHVPANARFDKEAREQLLDIFRDAADYWGDRKPSRTGEPGKQRVSARATSGRGRAHAHRQVIGRLAHGFAHEQPL